MIDGMVRVPVGAAELEVLVRGSGPPLLFLHGEDGLIHAGEVLDGLASHFQVFAPHHPGWGGSTRPDHVTDVADLALVYSEYLSGFAHRPTVVGASLGGWIAARVESTWPGTFADMVLLAPTGIKTRTREDRDFFDLYVHGDAEVRAALYGDVGRAPVLAGRPDADFEYLAVAQEATARFCWAPYMHDPKLVHALRRVRARTLVVSGGRESFILDPDYFERFAAAIGPTAERAVLEGRGHRVEEEAPEEVVALVRAFASATRTPLDRAEV